MTRVAQLLISAHPQGTKVHTVSPGTLIIEAVKLLKEKNIGALPVLDQGTMVGIITERDLVLRVLAEGIDPRKATVGSYMTHYPTYVSPLTDIMDCLNLMKELGVRHVPVLDKGKLMGIVSIRDVLYVLLKDQELLAQQFEAYIRGMN